MYVYRGLMQRKKGKNEERETKNAIYASVMVGFRMKCQRWCCVLSSRAGSESNALHLSHDGVHLHSFHRFSDKGKVLQERRCGRWPAQASLLLLVLLWHGFCSRARVGLLRDEVWSLLIGDMRLCME